MDTNPMITLIVGLILIFIVTYIVGFIIVKAKKLNKSNLSIILGFIFLLFGLISVFLFNDVKQYVFCIMGIFVIIDGMFMNKGYHNKTYYLVCLGMLVFFGLTVFYTALSINVYGEYFLYFSIGLFALATILFIRSYLRKHKNPKMPWKNEW